MPYVERDDKGAVKGLYHRAQPGRADEELPDDNGEVVDFQARMERALKRPTLSADGLAAVLIAKGYLTSEEAVAK